jgi:diguanylate cyclase (GGDEF)-like protein
MKTKIKSLWKHLDIKNEIRRNSMKKIIYLFLFLFCFSASYSLNDRNILVIHSYHHGLGWEDNISEGIKDTFDSEEFELFFEYLDGKRNYGEEYFNSLAQLYKQKANLTNFEAIIVCDNIALDFIIKYGPEFFPGVPVVFCGINNFNKEMLGDYKNIAGILENADHKKNIELILSLHKDIKNILIVNDNTVTGKAVREELEKIIPDYESEVNIDIYSDFSIEELKNRLQNIGSDTVIYLLVLNRDNTGKFVSYNDGLKLVTEVSNHPIYGAWDFYLGHGIVGGSILSGYIQGLEAGRLLKDIINSRDKDYAGQFKDGETKYMFDYNELEKFGISKSSLPKGSVIVNSPVNLIYKYHMQILSVTYLIIVILIINIFYKKKNEKKLIAMVHEKTLHLEKANQELEWISNIDGLTQLYNRRYFDKNLEDRWRELERNGFPLSILMIDVDYFKKYNDIYGHMAGDECLKKLSRVFFKSVGRPFDTVARYGGEEFTVLVSSDARGAEKIAKWILEEVENLEIPHAGSHRGIVTVSIGIGVAVPNDKLKAEKLLDTSDQALYESKNKGRNQYTLRYLELKQ